MIYSMLNCQCYLDSVNMFASCMPIRINLHTYIRYLTLFNIMDFVLDDAFRLNCLNSIK